MKVFEYIIREPVTEEARNRFEKVYPIYQSKIDYHVSTFPLLQNYDKEDVRSVATACLLKACIIHDPVKGKFSTLFWNLVHRFLHTLQVTDKAQKRRIHNICEVCNGTGIEETKDCTTCSGSGVVNNKICLICDGLGFLVISECTNCNGTGEAPSDFNSVSLDNYLEEYFDNSYFEETDSDLVKMLMKNFGVSDDMKLDTLEKTVCEYIFEGYSLSQIVEKLTHWEVKKAIRGIKMKYLVVIIDDIIEDVKKWKAEKRKIAEIKKLVSKKHSLRLCDVDAIFAEYKEALI